MNNEHETCGIHLGGVSTNNICGPTTLCIHPYLTYIHRSAKYWTLVPPDDIFATRAGREGAAGKAGTSSSLVPRLWTRKAPLLALGHHLEFWRTCPPTLSRACHLVSNFPRKLRGFWLAENAFAALYVFKPPMLPIQAAQVEIIRPNQEFSQYASYRVTLSATCLHSSQPLFNRSAEACEV